MNKISDRVEQIFAHAVAMDQSGKLRNTIYCLGSEVYIFNSDLTVLLRFPLRSSEVEFKHPVSFRANDYDSRQFYEENGKIIFVTENASFTRTKSCSTPGDTPEQIAQLFSEYEKITSNKIVLNRDVLSLLDDSLSHVEISAPGKNLSIVQRNIYSGAVLSLSRKEEEGLGISSADNIVTEFGPIGLRTNDFSALFTFVDNLAFHFPKTDDADYCYIRSIDPKMAFEGFIAHCIYDELGGVETSRKGNNHGREEQKDGRRQRQSDSAVDEKPTERQRSRRTR